MESIQDQNAAYLQSGPLTDLAGVSDSLADLPGDLAGLVRVTQGLLLHVFWAERYGVNLNEERQAEVQERHAGRKLARALELDPAPLTSARPPERRVIGNCRDFTQITTAFLRQQGIPARARCGFATYFQPDHFEDHWVVECWDPGRQRWAQVDSQLDELQRQALGIDFDPLDLPPGAFLTGGLAWQQCRRGQADPDQFGIFEYHGLDFVRGNLVRDVLALQGIELLPWDFWGLLNQPLADSPPETWQLMDELAVLSQEVDRRPEALRARYQKTADLHPPASWLA